VIIIAFLTIPLRILQAVSIFIPKAGQYIGMVMYAICVILMFLMFGASFIAL